MTNHKIKSCYSPPDDSDDSDSWSNNVSLKLLTPAMSFGSSLSSALSSPVFESSSTCDPLILSFSPSLPLGLSANFEFFFPSSLASVPSSSSLKSSSDLLAFFFTLCWFDDFDTCRAFSLVVPPTYALIFFVFFVGLSEIATQRRNQVS